MDISQRRSLSSENDGHDPKPDSDATEELEVIAAQPVRELKIRTAEVQEETAHPEVETGCPSPQRNRQLPQSSAHAHTPGHATPGHARQGFMSTGMPTYANTPYAQTPQVGLAQFGWSQIFTPLGLMRNPHFGMRRDEPSGSPRSPYPNHRHSSPNSPRLHQGFGNTFGYMSNRMPSRDPIMSPGPAHIYNPQMPLYSDQYNNINEAGSPYAVTYPPNPFQGPPLPATPLAGGGPLQNGWFSNDAYGYMATQDQYQSPYTGFGYAVPEVPAYHPVGLQAMPPDYLLGDIPDPGPGHHLIDLPVHPNLGFTTGSRLHRKTPGPGHAHKERRPMGNAHAQHGGGAADSKQADKEKATVNFSEAAVVDFAVKIGRRIAQMWGHAPNGTLYDMSGRHIKMNELPASDPVSDSNDSRFWHPRTVRTPHLCARQRRTHRRAMQFAWVQLNKPAESTDGASAEIVFPAHEIQASDPIIPKIIENVWPGIERETQQRIQEKKNKQLGLGRAVNVGNDPIAEPIPETAGNKEPQGRAIGYAANGRGRLSVNGFGNGNRSASDSSNRSSHVANGYMNGIASSSSDKSDHIANGTMTGRATSPVNASVSIANGMPNGPAVSYDDPSHRDQDGVDTEQLSPGPSSSNPSGREHSYSTVSEKSSKPLAALSKDKTNDSQDEVPND